MVEKKKDRDGQKENEEDIKARKRTRHKGKLGRYENKKENGAEEN